tara:strand:+ start:873 stop:1220 length:348 start_codon:yes stop_codon:yes gene_type:complete
MKMYALTIADDTVRVMQIVRDGISPSEVISQWHPLVKARMGVKSFREVQKTDLPGGPKLRHAWVDNGTRVVLDIPKARILRRKQLEADLGRKLTDPEIATINSKFTEKDLEEVVV